MKAYLKAFLLHFFKSGNWLLLMLFAGLILWQPMLTERPVYCVLAMFWFFVPLYAWQDARKKSGYSIYEYYSPISFAQRIAAEYVLGFVLCMMFAALMRFASPWISRLMQLFPVLGLICAGLEMPWIYLNKDMKVRIFVRVITVLAAYFLFTQLREVPLVIPSYPLWMIIGINLLIVLFYVLSALLAVCFIRKRGERI